MPSQLNFSIGSIVFDYGFTTASAAREGLFISARTGSPHISLEPVPQPPSESFQGDFWVQASGTDGAGNFRLVDLNPSDQSAYIGRLLVARESESVAQVVSRFTSSDAPSGTVLATNAIVADDWFRTANSPSVSGSGIRNETWQGGFFMPDENTVAIYGPDKTFLVPSGSVLVESGTFTVQSGSVTLLAASGQLAVSGTSASAFLQTRPVLSVFSGSANSSSFSPIDGTLYINTASNDISLRASGTWFDLVAEAPAVVDGGTY